MGFKRSRVQISSPRLPQTPTASQDAVGECTRLTPARIPKRLCTSFVHALRTDSRAMDHDGDEARWPAPARSGASRALWIGALVVATAVVVCGGMFDWFRRAPEPRNDFFEPWSSREAIYDFIGRNL